MEQPKQTDSPMSMSMSMSTSTSMSTASTTSAMDLHSSACTGTGTTGSVELTEDVVTQVINSSPASGHQDIWAGGQAINYSSSGNFTGLDMSTGGKLPGIATFSRPMTVTHEGYIPKVQRLGTILDHSFPHQIQAAIWSREVLHMAHNLQIHHLSLSKG